MCISCIIPRPNHNPSAPPNSVKNTIVVGLANFVSDIVVRGDGTKSRKLLLVKLSEFWINLSKTCLFFWIMTEKKTFFTYDNVLMSLDPDPSPKLWHLNVNFRFFTPPT